MAFDVEDDARAMTRSLAKFAGDDGRARVSVDDLAKDAFRKPRPARHLRQVWQHMQDAGWAGRSGTKVKVLLQMPDDGGAATAKPSRKARSSAAGRGNGRKRASSQRKSATGPKATLGIPDLFDAARSELQATRERLERLAGEVAVMTDEIEDRLRRRDALVAERNDVVEQLEWYREGLSGALADFFDTELGGDLWEYRPATEPEPVA